MQEAKVLELTLPEITVEDVFRAEGADYSKRPPRASQKELHRRILDETLSIIKPRAIWNEVQITGSGDQQLYLEGGFKLTSRLLAKMGSNAQSLALFAITLGPELEVRTSAYQQAGDMVEAFIMDSAGSAIIAKGGTQVLQEIENKYKQQGLETGFPMGPGHSYWQGLNDQKIIFQLLQPERIGLILNESNLIIPRKSCSMVVVVGKDLPNVEGKTHCDFCSLKTTCNIRKVVNT